MLNLVAPDGYRGAELFEGGSRGLVPLAVGIGAAGLLVAVAATVGARRRTRRFAWQMLAVLPPVAFAVQEHVVVVN